MKTIFKSHSYLKIIMIALVLPILSNCSKDDSQIISAPTVSFASTNFETTFFKSGNTSVPTVNWNGNQGTFNLSSMINGVTVNTSTGVISWSKELPLGINNIELIGSNSAGQVSVNITIENIFQGTFKGGYNDNPNSTILDINDQIYVFSSTGEVTSNKGFNGTWTKSGNTINTLFPKTNGISGYTEVYTLTYNSTEAILEGFWTNDGSATQTGYTKMIFMPQ